MPAATLNAALRLSLDDLAVLTHDVVAPVLVPLVADVLRNLSLRITLIAGRRVPADGHARSAGTAHRLDRVMARTANSVLGRASGSQENCGYPGGGNHVKRPERYSRKLVVLTHCRVSLLAGETSLPGIRAQPMSANTQIGSSTHTQVAGVAGVPWSGGAFGRTGVCSKMW